MSMGNGGFCHEGLHYRGVSKINRANELLQSSACCPIIILTLATFTLRLPSTTCKKNSLTEQALQHHGYKAKEWKPNYIYLIESKIDARGPL